MNNITTGAKSGANVIDNGAVTEMKNEPQASTVKNMSKEDEED